MSPPAVAFVRTGHRIGVPGQRAVVIDTCLQEGLDLRYVIHGDLSAIDGAVGIIERGDADTLVVAPHVLGRHRAEVLDRITGAGGRLHIAREARVPQQRSSPEIAARLRDLDLSPEQIADALGLDLAGVRALLRRPRISGALTAVAGLPAAALAQLKERPARMALAALLTALALGGLVASVPDQVIPPPYVAPSPPPVGASPSPSPPASPTPHPSTPTGEAGDQPRTDRPDRGERLSPQPSPTPPTVSPTPPEEPPEDPRRRCLRIRTPGVDLERCLEKVEELLP